MEQSLPTPLSTPLQQVMVAPPTQAPEQVLKKAEATDVQSCWPTTPCSSNMDIQINPTVAFRHSMLAGRVDMISQYIMTSLSRSS